MGKKMSLIIITIAMLMAISGCSAQKKPDAMVSEFIGDMKNFNLEEMASKVNPEDESGREEVTSLFEEEEDEFQKYFLDYMKSNAKKITYEIKESEIDGDSAVVSVKFKYIDGGPLFKATISEYITEAFSLIFSGKEMTDEENSEMFISIMEEQSEIIEDAFVEKTLDIKCINVDDDWYIDEPSEELLDVFMSNALSVAQEFEDSFDSSSYEGNDEPTTNMEQAKVDDMDIIEKGIGDEITFQTIKIKVNTVEETKTLNPTYGSQISAKEGAKFVLVGLDITNITKSEFSMEPNLILVDNQDREFSTYSDSIGSIDGYMDYRNLSPSIKESGYFIYELPEDATNYFMVVLKGGTNELYKIILK